VRRTRRGRWADFGNVNNPRKKKRESETIKREKHVGSSAGAPLHKESKKREKGPATMRRELLKESMMQPKRGLGRKKRGKKVCLQISESEHLDK